jgi:hypothetical protein
MSALARILVLLTVSSLGCGSDALPPADGGADATATNPDTIVPDGPSTTDVSPAPAPDTGTPPDATTACDFSARYSYGFVGGNSPYTTRSELAPGNKYTHSRSSLRSTIPSASCSPPMPTCGALDVITAYDIEVHDLARADVQAALAAPEPLIYGQDTRPVDGALFEFKRADGRGFLVGSPCQAAGCRAIPPGLAQLAKRLQDLDQQQLAAPECAALR